LKTSSDGSLRARFRSVLFAGNKRDAAIDSDDFYENGADASSAQALFINAYPPYEKKGLLKLKIQCNSMELASDVVQDLSKFFKLNELESEANFPIELERFEKVRNASAFSPHPSPSIGPVANQLFFHTT